MRILFLWTKTLLDSRSGAAATVKATMEALAEAGHECHAVTMTLFDGEEAFPLERVIDRRYLIEANRECFLQGDSRGISHWLFYTSSTVASGVGRREVEAFLGAAKGLAARIEPDLVLTMGSSPPAQYLHSVAHQLGASRLFYLANAGYDRAQLFAGFDAVYCPTRALARYYADRLGLNAAVVPTVFSRTSFVAPKASRSRHRSFVTMVDPSPEKGATLLRSLAALAARERPDLRFLVIEGRGTREQWRRAGLAPEALTNVHWLRNRRDMRPVYRRTSVLLYPSYCFEAGPRVPVEAQLSGIPVLASTRGGIPEQTSGGAYLFDLPSRCIEDYNAIPTDAEVRPWLDRLAALRDDPAAYAEAANAAVRAAERFHPDERAPKLADEIARLARLA